MGVHICNHPDEPHVVLSWLSTNTTSAATPTIKQFDNQREAIDFADDLVDYNPFSLRWLKVYRLYNSSDICWRWENSVPAKLNDLEVSITVDGKPFVAAAETMIHTVQIKHLKRSVRTLQIGQALTASALLLHVIDHLLR